MTIKGPTPLRAPRAELDTVGISIPIRDADQSGATVTILNAGTRDQKSEWRRTLPGGGFLAGGRGHSAWVEASIPKRIGEDNVEAVPLPIALEALEALHAEALEYVEPDRHKGGHSFLDANVKRLDFVRDFDGVASQSIMLDGLATVPLRGRVKRRRYADVKRNRAETLSVGNSVWLATLYDKHAETQGLAPEGRVRFEARMRSDRLTSEWAKKNGGHIRSLRDMTEEKCQMLRRGMFHRVGYDREVAASARVADLIASTDLSPREQRNLWAYLTMPGAGADPGFGTQAAAKYRRLAEELGVTVLQLDDAGPEAPVVMRLDYDRGTEVISRAA